MDEKRKTRKRRIAEPRDAARMKHFYSAFRPVRASVTVPEYPLYRLQTSRFGYYAFKYVLPASIALAYLAIMVYHLRLGETEHFSRAYGFISPVQLICLILIVPIINITSPLTHLIICEEGMFVRSATARVFVPWKYLRSYHESRHVRRWVVIMTFYTEKKRHRRIYAITSIETEHTMTEMLSFIRSVRRGSETEPVSVN
jgi:hypothetical protein